MSEWSPSGPLVRVIQAVTIEQSWEGSREERTGSRDTAKAESWEVWGRTWGALPVWYGTKGFGGTREARWGLAELEGKGQA